MELFSTKKIKSFSFTIGEDGTLPKGKIEPEESLENAAKRIRRKKLDLQAFLEEFVNTTFHIYKEKNKEKRKEF